jgi:hypothetical protein
MQKDLMSTKQILLISFFLLIQAFSTHTMALPAEVILIRHAEKPTDKKNMSLSEKGQERAKALAHLFERRPELKKTGLPVALFASAYIPGKGTKRPLETITPLTEVLKLKVDSSYAREDYEELAQFILKNPSFDKKTVMISWVHTFIPALAMALGIKSSREMGGCGF